MRRTYFVAGNWKMHNTLEEARRLMRGLRERLPRRSAVEVAVCPPFTLLHAIGQEIEGTPIRLGGQNVHWEPQGAFTGDISAAMLRDAGCSYVIIGHSERRHVFGETNQTLARKVPAALAAGLEVMGGFIVGFDSDEKDIFQRQFEFIQNTGAVTAMVGLLQALPRSRLYRRLAGEGRLRTHSRGDNTSTAFNFEPRLDGEFLVENYRRLMRRLYEPQTYYRRIRTFLATHRMRGTFTAYEQVAIRGLAGRSYVAHYCVPAQLVTPLFTKWMLVFEERDQDLLWLSPPYEASRFSPFPFFLLTQRGSFRYGRLDDHVFAVLKRDWLALFGLALNILKRQAVDPGELHSRVGFDRDVL